MDRLQPVRTPLMDWAAGTSQPRRNSTGRLSYSLSVWRMKPSEDVLSTTRFYTHQWKSILETYHKYDVVYRLLRVNRVMGELRKQFTSKEDMMYFAELLLGFEDRTWKDSQEELQYIRTMETFTDFCKQPPNHVTWLELVRTGRGMGLLKEVLQLYLNKALPTIFLVDIQNDQTFLLVGSQYTSEVEALFQQLTVSWNCYLHETNSDMPPVQPAVIPTNHISNETMHVAFGAPSVGSALRVFEGIINPISGLGLVLLPDPIAQYVQLLWHKEVLSSNFARRGQTQSQNILKVGFPWMCCSRCDQEKEVGTVFGLRTAGGSDKFAQILGFSMPELEQKMKFCRAAFKMTEVMKELNRTQEDTRLVCC